MRFVFFTLIILGALLVDAQESAEAVFKKSTEQLLNTNIELSMDVVMADAKGRSKAKSFDMLVASFKEHSKTKIVMLKPERAEGVTIVITNIPNMVGLIEVFTPANGKVRKMKATPENMKLVGFDFFLVKFDQTNTNDVNYTLLGEEVFTERKCYKIEAKGSSADKAELLIDKNNYQILKVSVFDQAGVMVSQTQMNNYSTVEGAGNKIYPMQIISTEMLSKKQNVITISTAKYRSAVKEREFDLEELAAKAISIKVE